MSSDEDEMFPDKSKVLWPDELVDPKTEQGKKENIDFLRTKPKDLGFFVNTEYMPLSYSWYVAQLEHLLADYETLGSKYYAEEIIYFLCNLAAKNSVEEIDIALEKVQAIRSAEEVMAEGDLQGLSRKSSVFIIQGNWSTFMKSFKGAKSTGAVKKPHESELVLLVTSLQFDEIEERKRPAQKSGRKN